MIPEAPPSSNIACFKNLFLIELFFCLEEKDKRINNKKTKKVQEKRAKEINREKQNEQEKGGSRRNSPSKGESGNLRWWVME